MNKLVEMQSQDFTINLVSNASMATFPNNTLAQFTTLLPQQLSLSGSWEVAVSEISWPSAIQNITCGEFKYQLRQAQPDDKEEQGEKTRKRAYGLVTMYTPPKIEDHIEERTCSIKPGLYSTVDQILESIFKKVFPNAAAKLPVTWKVDKCSQTLKVYFDGSERDCILLEATSNDLQNVLGLKTVIDCKESSSTSRTSPMKSKTVGKFPIDISGGCNTIFLYCDLVQNEILGDSQTALLRAIPLSNFLSEHRGQQYLNYQTFTNLQWRRIVKSSIESITISLRSESGQLLPFLSRGRTNITLQFRQR